MTPSEINEMLADRALEVCTRLFPNGKHVGNEYHVGNVYGESGQSLRVPLSGRDLLGGFNDFESGEKGDLIKLWQLSGGLSFYETMKEIKAYLGVKDDYSGDVGKLAKSGRPQKKVKTLPKSDPVDQVPKWSKYFDNRKISAETLNRYNVGIMKDSVLFPHYFDGELIMWHTRDYKKDENGNYTIKDGKPVKDFGTNKSPLYCLWGWDGIKDTDREVVLTEGRIDALSYIEQEIPAMSVPCGGGKGGKQAWIDFDYHHLIDHFDRFYISMDADESGSAGLSEIISRLGEHRCWIVNLPDGHKDANDAHVAGVDLKKCLLKAKQIMPEGLHRGGEFTNDIIEYFYPNEQTDKSIFLPWEKSKGYKARLGEVTLIAGENGSGKTQVVGNIMLGGFEQRQVFGVASMEMNPKMLLGRLTKQATASKKPTPEYIDIVSRHFNEWLWVYKKKGVADVDKILSSFLYLNKRYGVKYFIIDSLAKCGIKEDDYNRQKDLIDELEAFADDNQCHIFLVHHVRKKDSNTIDKPPGKSDIKGTGAISDMIDNIIIVWRNRPKEEFLENEKVDFENEKERKKYETKLNKMKKASDAILNFAKQRNGDWEGKVPLWFDRNCYQYLGRQGNVPYKFVKYPRQDD